ncbi:MAG: response regulator transcription factor [Desulfatiglandaceae bacterium]
MAQKITMSSGSDKTKILIVDDHPAVIEGIIRALEKEPGFEVVGTALDGLQAVKQVKTLNPDMAIMDISMPNMKGMDAAHEIKAWKERIHVLIYTMYSDREYITSLFRIGVSAYILKREPIKELIQAVKVVRDGGTYFSSSVRKVLQDQLDALTMGDLAEVRRMQNGIAQLTVRQKEIFALLADGLIPKEIAVRLCISPKTVETHKYNIMEKLEVSSVAQLTKIAIKKGLIEV